MGLPLPLSPFTASPFTVLLPPEPPPPPCPRRLMLPPPCMCVMLVITNGSRRLQHSASPPLITNASFCAPHSLFSHCLSTYQYADGVVGRVSIAFEQSSGPSRQSSSRPCRAPGCCVAGVCSLHSTTIGHHSCPARPPTNLWHWYSPPTITQTAHRSEEHRGSTAYLWPCFRIISRPSKGTPCADVIHLSIFELGREK